MYLKTIRTNRKKKEKILKKIENLKKFKIWKKI